MYIAGHSREREFERQRERERERELGRALMTLQSQG